MINTSFSVVDIEVTEEKEIIQIAILNLDKNLKIIGEFNYYFKPKNEISPFLVNLTGITNEMLENQKSFSDLAEEIYDKLKNSSLICHGVLQDYSILKEEFLKANIYYKPKSMIDTVDLCKIFFPSLSSYKLSELAENLGINANGDYHRADTDAFVTYELLFTILKKIARFPMNNYQKIIDLLKNYSYDMYFFINNYKGIFIDNNYKEDLFIVNNISFRKIIIKSGNNISNKNLYITSIPEEKYISKCIKDSNSYTIIKNYSEYINLNFLDNIEKKYDFNTNINQLLYMKILVWIAETKQGDLSELNLDYNEKVIVDYFRAKNKKENYYYNKALEVSKSTSFLVTNYKSLLNLIIEKEYEDCNLIFDDKHIMGLEIRKLFAEEIYFKDILTELNKVYSKYNNLKIKNLRDNLEIFIKNLHEIYVKDNLSLYKDSIEIILQELATINEDFIRLNFKLIHTSKFLKKLYFILNFSNMGYYKFVIVNNPNSFYLK
ncbi:exonuclease domain-containing protein, partial [Gemella sp. zg-1178]|uniref:exonuclease domain-containing protein n=1 Tax=Gemella sp. zg-1178 TaxID=2840372 RepID=UPI001C0482BE